MQDETDDPVVYSRKYPECFWAVPLLNKVRILFPEEERFIIPQQTYTNSSFPCFLFDAANYMQLEGVGG